MYSENLDQPLYGAESIGRAAHLFDDAGNVDVKRAYYVLERGYIDASKIGRQWVTTMRRIRRAFVGGQS
jgi:hypothetical protein